MLDHIKKHRAHLSNTYAPLSEEIKKGGQGSGRKPHQGLSKDARNAVFHTSYRSKQDQHEFFHGGEAHEAFGEKHANAAKEFMEQHHVKVHNINTDGDDFKEGEKASKFKVKMKEQGYEHFEYNEHDDSGRGVVAYKPKSAKKNTKGGENPGADKDHPEHNPIKKSFTPFEYEALIKSQIAGTIGGESISVEEMEKGVTEYFEKGGRKANMGETRQYNGKDYIKTANGWKLVGKKKGKYKDAHDVVHGPKKRETEAFEANYKAASEEQRKHVAKQYFDDENKDLTKVGAHHHEQLSDALYEKVEADKKGMFDDEVEDVLSTYYKKDPQERTKAARELAEKQTTVEGAKKWQDAFEDENFHGLAELFKDRASRLKTTESMKQRHK